MNDTRQVSAKEGFPYETVLLDGTPILVRPVRPEDKPLIKIGLEQLSPADRYNRFFAPLSQFSDDMLRQFTEIDHVNEEAIAALDQSASPPNPIGIARYVRSSDDPGVAEIAATVVGSHQGIGLGTLLLAFLAKKALQNGIDVFSATVLVGNDKMQNLFDELEPVSKTASGGIVDYRIALHRDPEGYPHTPAGDVFREVMAKDAPFKQAV